MPPRTHHRGRGKPCLAHEDQTHGMPECSVGFDTHGSRPRGLRRVVSFSMVILVETREALQRFDAASTGACSGTAVLRAPQTHPAPTRQFPSRASTFLAEQAPAPARTTRDAPVAAPDPRL